MRLSKKLNLLVIIPIIIYSLIIGVMSYTLSYNILLEEKKIEARTVMDFYIDEVTPYLIQEDWERVEFITNNLISNTRVLESSLVNSEGEKIFEYLKEGYVDDHAFCDEAKDKALITKTHCVGVSRDKILVFVEPLKVNNKDNYLIIEYSISDMYVLLTEIMTYFCIVTLILAVTLFVFGNRTAKKISTPINKIKDFAHNISSGGFDAKPIPIGRKEIFEIRELALELEIMREELIKTTSDLKDELKAEKSAKNELEKAYNKLKELDTLKDEFLANISHELKTPLTNIKSFNQLIKDEVLGPIGKKQKDALVMTLHSIDELTELINSILSVTSYEKQKVHFDLRKEDLNLLLKKAVKKYSHQIEKIGGKLKLDIKLDDKKILLDKSKISEVLQNLISNSIKYKDRKKKLVLEISAKSTLKNALITIKDNGIGIHAKNHFKIFEKFFQVDESYSRTVQGLGIGLFLVKKIIEEHKGEISVSSKLGVGTIFTIILPYK
ncbi:hypothetical protein GOV05_00195 [Candidatus Woesearchaeota archaeon]|nr:hypothetical protein [Candidatus Woesearchaeota archaeon]